MDWQLGGREESAAREVVVYFLSPITKHNTRRTLLTSTTPGSRNLPSPLPVPGLLQLYEEALLVSASASVLLPPRSHSQHRRTSISLVLSSPARRKKKSLSRVISFRREGGSPRLRWLPSNPQCSSLRCAHNLTMVTHSFRPICTPSFFPSNAATHKPVGRGPESLSPRQSMGRHPLGTTTTATAAAARRPFPPRFPRYLFLQRPGSKTTRTQPTLTLFPIFFPCSPFSTTPLIHPHTRPVCRRRHE